MLSQEDQDVITTSSLSERLEKKTDSQSLQKVIELLREPLLLLEEELVLQARAFRGEMEPYISYACQASGKRLRPLIVFLAGGVTGGIQREHAQLALILELIHIATLVHDDILDGAILRRNLPTMMAKWGSSKSVLVGDILFAHALRLSISFENRYLPERIADATTEVCSGEILQMDRRFDLTLNQEDYYQIIQMKTGSLFTIAAELGATINKSKEREVSALKEYGVMVGTAYQILDDCLDFLKNSQSLGKTLGTDLLTGKFTLPILLLHQHTRNQEELEQLLLKPEKSPQEISRIIDFVEELQILPKAFQVATSFLERAQRELMTLPNNPYLEGLQLIILYLRERFPREITLYTPSQ